jgi:hypothetical protein
MAKRQTQKRKLPEPSLEHLNRLTDDTGLFQHAKFTIPLRSEGYTTDDNARAIIVTAKHYALYHKPQTLQLLDKYLEYVLHACSADGSVKNFMNYDGTWLKNETAGDAFGRSIWAFGTLLKNPPSDMYIPIAKERIDIALPLIEKQSPRGKAYLILGLAGYLKRFPEADNVRECLKTAGETIVKLYEDNHQVDWLWFEDKLTYDNAILPSTLLSAGMILNENKFLNVAHQTCDFLLANTFSENHFSFIGCNGWFPRGGKKAQFDQQPIEAVSTILMLNEAFMATKDRKYLLLRQKAFNWFLGENDLGVPLYDSDTKGCSDGLGEKSISLNQGAESTLSFLLALLTIQEKYLLR